MKTVTYDNHYCINVIINNLMEVMSLKNILRYDRKDLGKGSLVIYNSLQQSNENNKEIIDTDDTCK